MLAGRVRRLLAGAPSLSRAQVTLLDAAAANKLLPSSARQLTVKVAGADSSTVRLLDIFVIRDADGQLRAFENYCPHAGGALNMLPDRFFTRDGAALLCTRHGARFAPADGSCFHGPCAGDALHALDIALCEAGSVHTTMVALKDLCENGGGAYILREADSPEAQGPLVQRPDESLPPPRSRRARSYTTSEGQGARAPSSEPSTHQKLK